MLDARGNVWVSVGNGSVRTAGQPFDDSDSLLELASLLHLRQYLASLHWAENDSRDLDCPLHWCCSVMFTSFSQENRAWRTC
ncbi:MAG: hypothetical protein ACYCPT_11080 [Acidimicrobiales bacterium]